MRSLSVRGHSAENEGSSSALLEYAEPPWLDWLSQEPISTAQNPQGSAGLSLRVPQGTGRMIRSHRKIT